MFERRHHNLAPLSVLLSRLLTNAAFGVVVIAVALGVGVLGYYSFEPMSLVDAFCNAAMILSGMGPVTALTHDSAKVFAGFYALFSGLIFIFTVGVIYAPLIHRFMHKFHLDMREEQNREKQQ